MHLAAIQCRLGMLPIADALFSRRQGDGDRHGCGNAREAVRTISALARQLGRRDPVLHCHLRVRPCPCRSSSRSRPSMARRSESPTGFFLSSSCHIAHGIVARHIRLDAIWAAPLALVCAAGFCQRLLEVGLHLSRLAAVAFGGVCSILSYMSQTGRRIAAGSPQRKCWAGSASRKPGGNCWILAAQFAGYLAGNGAGGLLSP